MNTTTSQVHRGTFFLIALGVIVVGTLAYFFSRQPAPTPNPDTTSTPHVTAPTTTVNPINIITPTASSTITSPLSIQGSAPGTWFFEASFPIELVDAQGNGMAMTQAKASSDWMTTNMVPFTATLIFTAKPGEHATLIFKKDNPSGLPENAGEFRVPVTL